MTIDEKTLTTALRAASRLTVTDAEHEAALRRLHRGIERHRRDRLRAALAAVVAAVLVVGGGVVWLAERGAIRSIGPSGAPSTSVTTTPRDITPIWPEPTPGQRGYPDGLVGIPALGAVPSVPETGRLVGQYRVAGMPFQGLARVYDDGRIIWYRFYGNQFQRSTGYVEQRLTAEGIRLVLARADGDAHRDPWNLADWLPATAWADRTIRPYVPRAFEFCVGTRTDGPSVEAPDPSLFPTDVAQRLLGAHPPSRAPGDQGPDARCLRVSTEDARTIAASLLAAGFTQEKVFAEGYQAPLPGHPGWTYGGGFEPVFPDGSTGCSGCG